MRDQSDVSDRKDGCDAMPDSRLQTQEPMDRRIAALNR